MPSPRPNAKEQVPIGIMRLLSTELMTRAELRDRLQKESCSSIDHALSRLIAAGLVEKLGVRRGTVGRRASVYGVSSMVRSAPPSSVEPVRLSEKESELLARSIANREAKRA